MRMFAGPAAATLTGWFQSITSLGIPEGAPSSFMATKAIYTVVAAVGIAAASAGAWWYQNKAATPRTENTPAAGEAAQSGGAAAPARPPAVEVARVEVA